MFSNCHISSGKKALKMTRKPNFYSDGPQESKTPTIGLRQGHKVQKAEPKIEMDESNHMCVR
jgi:hypothetical protein